MRFSIGMGIPIRLIISISKFTGRDSHTLQISDTLYRHLNGITFEDSCWRHVFWDIAYSESRDFCRQRGNLL